MSTKARTTIVGVVAAVGVAAAATPAAAFVPPGHGHGHGPVLLEVQ